MGAPRGSGKNVSGCIMRAGVCLANRRCLHSCHVLELALFCALTHAFRALSAPTLLISHLSVSQRACPHPTTFAGACLPVTSLLCPS